MIGWIAALYGLCGVLALLGFAIFRLAPRGLEALEHELSVLQWILLVVFSLFMLVAEGYRGFQKKFSPRTAARIRYLKDHPSAARVILAPVFCMGFFGANKKTRITAFALTGGIIILVLLVSLLAQPWRGIIDVGVVLGLSWGILSLLIYTAKALFTDRHDYSPEMPEGE